jgi:hypothetical protein
METKPPRMLRRFLDRLAVSPRGRAYLLQFLVGAEEADEIGVFDQLVARIDDPQLNKLAAKHRADEERHAAVFKTCVARQGVDIASLPVAPSVIAFIDEELHGFAARFVAGKRSVMEAYVLLQVIEERAVAQYPWFADALEPYDPTSAAVVREVACDEVNHIKYAKAISKRYAPNQYTLDATLRQFRAAEQRALDRHGRAFLASAVDARLLDVTRAEQLGWRVLVALGGRPRVPATNGLAVPAQARAASFT